MHVYQESARCLSAYIYNPGPKRANVTSMFRKNKYGKLLREECSIIKITHNKNNDEVADKLYYYVCKNCLCSSCVALTKYVLCY